MKYIHSLANNENRHSLASQLRKRRFVLLQNLIDGLPKPISVLDVGGTEHFWKIMDFVGEPDVHITLFNLEAVPISFPNFTSSIGDARQMNQFATDEFDVVFSNSVIEHVGNFAQQKMMAQEICRVGKRYFVQTPNYYFPLEPHTLFPAFQWLPVPLRVALVQRFNLGWIGKITDGHEAQKIVKSIRLLKRQEVKSLFPDGELYQERIFGLVKSFVAYGGWENSQVMGGE